MTTNDKINAQNKAIGRMVRETIERRYGKQWKACVSNEIAKAIVAREAYVTMVNAMGGGTAEQMAKHGRDIYTAGCVACGIAEED